MVHDKEKANAVERLKEMMYPPQDVLNDILESNKNLMGWIERLKESGGTLEERIFDFDRDRCNSENRIRKDVSKLEKRVIASEKFSKKLEGKIDGLLLYIDSQHEFNNCRLLRVLRWLKIIP